MRRKQWQIIWAIGLIGFLMAGHTWAASFPDISAQALKKKMDGGEKMVLVNPLSDIEFNEAHIPGSVNIPLHLIPTSDRLPADKSVPVVTYCLGPK